jgi:hypothetical protein
MASRRNTYGRKRGRGARPWLIAAKLIGVIGLLGGLASLAALGFFGPRPETLEGWRLIKAAMRAIFFPVMFAGIIITVSAGLTLWLQMPGTFLRMRWFRLKALLLVVAIPTLHLWARGRVMAFYHGLDAAQTDPAALADLPDLWGRVAQAYLTALIVFFAIAMIGRIKPRLRQPVRPFIRHPSE